MTSQWLSWISCLLVGLIVCLLLGMGWIWIQRPSEIVCTDPISKQCRLPKNAFALKKEVYQQMGEPFIALQQAPPSLQLPDLKQHLIYYGKNGRPDANSSHTHLHFSFTGNKNVVSIVPGEKQYLLYDKKVLPSHYVFSPNNVETSLWIEVSPVDNEALVKVFMKNEKGEIIKEPETHIQFKLPEKEFIRYAGSSWEIGSWRVDGTLLARQRARWYGIDKFLERHGGEEYKFTKGKQRIDIGENDDVYSIFVDIGDCLIWDGKQWKEIVPGPESLKHPLLVIKKVDERLMTLELWDTEGKGKVLLNILKSTEPWLLQNPASLQQTFKFVGAKTRTQCVFEINKERMIISPADWLLLTPKGWKKLETEEDIDAYVKRKTPGTLFVFEGLSRAEDKQTMNATIYNPTRSDFQSVELALQQVGSRSTSRTQANKESKQHSYDDDEDDDNDDDEDEMENMAIKMHKGSEPEKPKQPGVTPPPQTAPSKDQPIKSK